MENVQQKQKREQALLKREYLIDLINRGMADNLRKLTAAKPKPLRMIRIWGSVAV